MTNPPSDPQPGGVLEVSWALFGELCRALAMRVAGSYDPELVVGITKAGVIPGVVVASILQRDFVSMGVTRVGSAARPTLITEPPPIVRDRNVLIVDETCDSGATLKLATSAVRKFEPANIRTAVSFRTGPYDPDFYAMTTDNFIVLPWDREVIVDGELVVRPDYVGRLGDFGR